MLLNWLVWRTEICAFSQKKHSFFSISILIGDTKLNSDLHDFLAQSPRLLLIKCYKTSWTAVFINVAMAMLQTRAMGVVLLDTDALLVFILVFGLVYAYIRAKRPNHFPPGPKGVPFLGNSGDASQNRSLHHTFMDLSRRYGPIVGLQLGWYPTIVISDYKIIKKAFDGNPEIFSNRPNHIALYKIIGLDSGLVNSNGEVWSHFRTLALTSLKNFGLGKSSIEVVIHDEASLLLDFIEKQHGKPFHVNQMFQKVSSNIMCSMLFGERFAHDSQEFETLLHDIDNLVALSGIQTGIFLHVPFLIPTAPFRPQVFRALYSWRNLQWVLQRKITEHQKSFDPKNIRDFVDVYIDGQQKQGDHSGISWVNTLKDILFNGVSMKERNLFVAMIDLFIAGSETVATTLDWSMFYFLKYPDIQEKCRQEIVQKIGNRRPCLADRVELPYLEATISEIQRLASAVPHAGLHATSLAVEFEGYHIPAQTVVIPDYYTIHRDPKLWTDPENFRPERFLGSDGKVIKPPYLMPFSTGKRMCFGENLARSELFLFLASMLQQYRFLPEGKEQLPHISNSFLGGVIHKIQNFRIQANRL